MEILFNNTEISDSMKAVIYFGFAGIFIAIGLRFTMDYAESDEQGLARCQSRPRSGADAKALEP